MVQMTVQSYQPARGSSQACELLYVRRPLTALLLIDRQMIRFKMSVVVCDDKLQLVDPTKPMISQDQLFNACCMHSSVKFMVVGPTFSQVTDAFS